MVEHYVAGLDVGFIKTGMTVFRLVDQGTDTLVHACTLESGFEKSGISGQSAMDDINAARNVLQQIDHCIDTFNVRAVFAEIPHGGAQSSRAARCMGIATGWIAAMERYNPDIEFELYTPVEVEKTLGIHLLPSQAQQLGLKKGESTKYKKERIKNLVESIFPDFHGWPDRPKLAEDSYDSAAAFLCGRAKNKLYRAMKEFHR